jgi:hypothetical protein
LLLYHLIRKTFDDFEKGYRYRIDGEDGELIDTDKELKPGQIIILKGISEYAIIVRKVRRKTDNVTSLMILQRKL